MTYEKSAVSILKNIACETKEQTVEADLILPEYYPEIAKILKLCVTAYEESVTVTDGKFSVAGCAEIRLIYCDSENNPSCFTSETKYTKVISCAGLKPEDYVCVKQNVVNVNYKAVGPKKTEVRAVISVGAEIKTIEKKEYVSSVENGAEFIGTEKKHMEPVCAICKSLTVSECMEEVQMRDKNIRPFRTSCVAEISEKKCVKNKLMLKGTVKTETAYLTEDNTVKKFEAAIPFTEVTDAYGLDEDTVCVVGLVGAYADVRFSENVGETVKADVSSRIRLSVFGFRETDVCVISDCFSVENNIEASYGELELLTSAEALSSEISRSFDAELYDDNAGEVLYAFFDNLSFAPAGQTDEPTVCGSLTLNALMRSKDGVCSMVVRNVSFEQKTEYGTVTESILPGLSADASVKGEKLVFRGKLYLHSLKYGEETSRYLSAAEEEKREKAKNGGNIVLYYAEKGESVWEIAKSNRVPVASVRKNNSLTGERLEDNKLLIFSDF